MNIEIERIYEMPGAKQGYRILVDRLWPRGLRKDEAHIDLWLKEIAPSTELRKWFAHDPNKWPTFKRKYFQELERKQTLVDQLISNAESQTLVLLYGAKDTEHNQAVALKEYIVNRYDRL